MKIVTTRSVFVAGHGGVEPGKVLDVSEEVAADLFIAFKAKPHGKADKAEEAETINNTIAKGRPLPRRPRRRGFGARLF